MVKTYCSRCGKCMTDTNDTTSTAVHISFAGEATPFMRQQLGRYPMETYQFCWECLLDSLFAGAFGLKMERR